MRLSLKIAASAAIVVAGLGALDRFLRWMNQPSDLWLYSGLLGTISLCILKDIVRNSLNEVASTYTLEDIYGENKAKFLRETRARIQDQVTPVGVGIQQFGFIGKPRFTEAIERAITQKTQAITEAESARNQLAVTQAEVAKMVAQAEGDAKSQIERARGEAESNRLRNASLTPQLLELKRLENDRARIEKWNGDVPRMVVGDKTGMMLQMPYDSDTGARRR